MTTTIRRLTLSEFRTECGVQLSIDEREALRRLHPGIRIEPAPYSPDRYDLTPDQRIGLVCLPSLVVEIRPKVSMSSVLFMVSYACDRAHWLDRHAEFGQELDLAEIVAIILSQLIQQATRRGLLNGYQTDEAALQAPRGRILFDEQIRHRMGVAPPIEVRHDRFTADVLENRLLLAALAAFRRLTLRSDSARRELRRARRLLGAVTYEYFAPSAVPEVVFTRLNQHYRPALALAGLVLRSASLNLGTGGATGSAFLIDMNEVFEQFVRTAFRVALGLETGSFPEHAPPIRLDEAGVIPLKPDLCLVRQQRVVWVGDAKYKRLPLSAYRNADLYQLLAYAVALGLPDATLIYAADAGVRGGDHVVVRARTRLHMIAIDLGAPRVKILQEIAQIACRIKRSCVDSGDLRSLNPVAASQSTPGYRWPASRSIVPSIGEAAGTSPL